MIGQLSPSRLGALCTVVLLMPANWLMEAIKWRGLIPQPPSRWAAYRAVLLGNSVGLTTPANIGDYAGRLSVLNKDQYPAGLAATLVSSITQNVVNVAIGSIGALYLIVHLEYTGLSTIWVGISIVAASIVGLGLIWYTQSEKVRESISRLGIKYPVVAKITALIDQFDRSHIGATLGYSSIRYVIYSIQYLLVLYAVGIHLPLSLSLAGIATIYLVQSGLPLPPMLGLLARGETAILVWGAAADGNIVPILVASFGLWLINRAVAALAGLAFWFQSSRTETTKSK
jgi:hypothetical protein